MEDINENLFYFNFCTFMLIIELTYDIFLYFILRDNIYFMLCVKSKQMASHVEHFYRKSKM